MPALEKSRYSYSDFLLLFLIVFFCILICLIHLFTLYICILLYLNVKDYYFCYLISITFSGQQWSLFVFWPAFVM